MKRAALGCCATTAALALSCASAAAAQEGRQQAVFQQPAAAPAARSLFRLHANSTEALQHLLAASASPDSDGRIDVWARRTESCSPLSAASGRLTSPGCYLDIASTRSAFERFTDTSLHDGSLSVEVLQPDLDALVRSQVEQNQRAALLADDGDGPDYGDPWHDRYHSYEEIQAYLQHIATTYPSHAQLISLGKTHEGRSLTALKLGHFGPAAAGSRPHHEQQQRQASPPKPKLGVLVMANQHAREWISGATALHLIHQILTDELELDLGRASALDQTATASRKGRKKGRKDGPAAHRNAWAGSDDLLEVFDITILPLANPDGYAYSYGSERMWRKNRQPVDESSECVGIDVNSNWDARFQAWPVSRACSEAFPGTRAFEAYESDAIARFIAEPANNIRSVIDLHSYGQMLTYPFAFSCSPSLSLPDEEDLLELSVGAVRAIRDVHSHTFHAGRHCALAWELAGSALDWSYGWFPAPAAPSGTAGVLTAGKRRSPRRRAISPSPVTSSSTPISAASSLQPRTGNLVKWSFALELRDGGTYGFLLPADQIRPSGQEAGALMRYTLQFIAKREKRL
ncbi:hypothetical protein OC842_000881 [Tilletia horrida]|uniref:Inactive metallocarboxypeptidase ECM14 n=1 Tax=Tilletia horrida TaxID=155126 RepID=A0AAN6JP15_9BASI|nr:hypothetical protein OC842_000881 [Tilletia horrida]